MTSFEPPVTHTDTLAKHDVLMGQAAAIQLLTTCQTHDVTANEKTWVWLIGPDTIGTHTLLSALAYADSDGHASVHSLQIDPQSMPSDSTPLASRSPSYTETPLSEPSATEQSTAEQSTTETPSIDISTTVAPRLEPVTLYYYVGTSCVIFMISGDPSTVFATTFYKALCECRQTRIAADHLVVTLDMATLITATDTLTSSPLPTWLSTLQTLQALQGSDSLLLVIHRVEQLSGWTAFNKINADIPTDAALGFQCQRTEDTSSLSVALDRAYTTLIKSLYRHALAHLTSRRNIRETLSLLRWPLQLTRLKRWLKAVYAALDPNKTIQQLAVYFVDTGTTRSPIDALQKTPALSSTAHTNAPSNDTTSSASSVITSPLSTAQLKSMAYIKGLLPVLTQRCTAPAFQPPQKPSRPLTPAIHSKRRLIRWGGILLGCLWLFGLTLYCHHAYQQQTGWLKRLQAVWQLPSPDGIANALATHTPLWLLQLIQVQKTLALTAHPPQQDLPTLTMNQVKQLHQYTQQHYQHQLRTQFAPYLSLLLTQSLQQLSSAHTLSETQRAELFNTLWVTMSLHTTQPTPIQLIQHWFDDRWQPLFGKHPKQLHALQQALHDLLALHETIPLNRPIVTAAQQQLTQEPLAALIFSMIQARFPNTTVPALPALSPTLRDTVGLDTHTMRIPRFYQPDSLTEWLQKTLPEHVKDIQSRLWILKTNRTGTTQTPHPPSKRLSQTPQTQSQPKTASTHDALVQAVTQRYVRGYFDAHMTALQQLTFKKPKDIAMLLAQLHWFTGALTDTTTPSKTKTPPTNNNTSPSKTNTSTADNRSNTDAATITERAARRGLGPIITALNQPSLTPYLSLPQQRARTELRHFIEGKGHYQSIDFRLTHIVQQLQQMKQQDDPSKAYYQWVITRFKHATDSKDTTAKNTLVKDTAAKEDTLQTLFTTSDTLLEPMKHWLTHLNQSTWGFLLEQARVYLNRIWLDTISPFCAQEINPNYPIQSKSNTPISYQEFNGFFGPGGSMNSFFNLFLTPLVNTQSNYWTWKTLNGQSIPITQKTLDMFIRASLIQQMFYEHNPNQLGFAFTLTVKQLPASLQAVVIHLDGQTFVIERDGDHLRYTPANPRHFIWPLLTPNTADTSTSSSPSSASNTDASNTTSTNPMSLNTATNNVSLTFINPQNRRVTIQGTGPWAFFRWVALAKLTMTDDPRVFQLHFAVPQSILSDQQTTRSAEPEILTLTLMAKDKINPLLPNVLSAFQCPAELKSD